MRGRSVLCGGFLIISACGGGGGGATASPPPLDAGGDQSDRTALAASDLLGGWYATAVFGDGGADAGAVPSYRRRFVDQTYYEVWIGPSAICAETGSFALADGKVTV